MELLTKDQTERLLANGKASAAAIQRDGNTPDHFPVVKLFNPVSAGTWLLTELDPTQPDIAYGLCDLGMEAPELGSVSLSELRSVRVGFGLGIERDIHWTATHPLSVYTALAYRHRFILTNRDLLEKEANKGRRAGSSVTDRASLEAAAGKGGAA